MLFIDVEGARQQQTIDTINDQWKPWIGLMVTHACMHHGEDVANVLHITMTVTIPLTVSL